MYEVFEQLLQKHGITTYKVAKETGIAQSVFSSWKTGVSSPKQDKLQKIADYFSVSIDYLVTGKESEDKISTLTTKDERDISKKLKDTLTLLENQQEALMFDGKIMDEQTRELLKASLENSIRIAKINAKDKYTPNKYR